MSSVAEQLEGCVERGDIELPVLPAVGMEVMSLARGDDSDAEQLAKLIQNDVALAGNIIRLANSAAYSRGNIQTLQQAITQLGLRQIAQMALTVSVGESAFKSSSLTAGIVEYLWKHALASAAWAREIARICRSNTEVAFLCGLLHQIGKPVTVNTLTKLLEQEEASLSSQQEMLDAMDKYASVIGVNVARRWNLPEPVVETINYLDDYFAAPSAKQEVMVVNAARCLATSLLEGQSAEEIATLAKQTAVFTELNFYEDDIDDLMDKMPAVEALIDSLTL